MSNEENNHLSKLLPFHGSTCFDIGEEFETVKRRIQKLFIMKSCDCCKCEFESLFVAFKYRGNKFILGGLYRHANGKVNHFTQDLEKTLDKVG